MRFTLRQREHIPETPKIEYEWDKEQRKLNVLSLVFIVLLAVMAILFTISVVHGHL